MVDCCRRSLGSAAIEPAGMGFWGGVVMFSYPRGATKMLNGPCRIDSFQQLTRRRCNERKWRADVVGASSERCSFVTALCIQAETSWSTSDVITILLLPRKTCCRGISSLAKGLQCIRDVASARAWLLTLAANLGQQSAARLIFGITMEVSCWRPRCKLSDVTRLQFVELQHKRGGCRPVGRNRGLTR